MVTQLKYSCLSKFTHNLHLVWNYRLGQMLYSIFFKYNFTFSYILEREIFLSVSFLTNFLNVKNKELHSSPETINLCQCPLGFYKTEITTYLSFFAFFTSVGIYLAGILRQFFICILYFVRFYLHFRVYFFGSFFLKN